KGEEHVLFGEQIHNIALADSHSVKHDSCITAISPPRERMNFTAFIDKLHLNIHLRAIGVHQPLAGFLPPERRAAERVCDSVGDGGFALTVRAVDVSDAVEVDGIFVTKTLETTHCDAENMEICDLLHRPHLTLPRRRIRSWHTRRTHFCATAL